MTILERINKIVKDMPEPLRSDKAAEILEMISGLRLDAQIEKVKDLEINDRFSKGHFCEDQIILNNLTCPDTR